MLPPFDETELGLFFKKAFEEKTYPKEPPIDKIMLKELAESEDPINSLKKMFKDFSNTKPVCAKVMKHEPSVTCLDCRKDETSIFCMECFENSNHKGHKIIYNEASSGCCDCGDIQGFKEEGFCKYHVGYDKYRNDTNFDNIPIEFKDNFHKTFSKTFYYLFALIDLLNQSQIEEEKVEESEEIKNYIISNIVLSIISALLEIIQVSPLISLLLCKFLKSKLDYNCILLHKCTNLLFQEVTNTQLEQEMKIQSKNKDQCLDLDENEGQDQVQFQNQGKDQPQIQGKGQYCECTFLENLFRYSPYFNKKTQKQLEDFLILLFIDYEFKQYIAMTYLKMINFIYPATTIVNEYDNTITVQYNDFTQLCNLSVQLFTGEEFAVMAVNSEYMPLLLDLFENMIKSKIMNESQYIIHYYFQIFKYIMQKKNSRLSAICNRYMILKWLDYIELLVYDVKLNIQKNRNAVIGVEIIIQELEYKLLHFLDIEFRELSLIQDEALKLQLCKEYGARIKKQIQDIPKKLDDMKDDCRSLSLTILKVYAYFLKNIISEYTNTESLNQLYSKIMELSGNELEVFNEIIFKYTIRSHGYVRDIQNNACDYNDLNIIRAFRMMYSIPKALPLDCELLLLQVSMLYIKPNKLCELLTQNFSTYKFFNKIMNNNDQQKALEILEQVAKDQTKSKIFCGLLEDYVTLLVSLMINDFHYATLLCNIQKYFEETDLSPILRHYEELLINILQRNIKLDYRHLREILDKKFILGKINIDSPLNTISTFDKKTKSFQLKTEYKGIFDIFILNRDNSLQYELEEELKNRYTNTDFDIISGCNSKAYLVQKGTILYDIQKKLNSSDLLINKILFCLLHAELFGTNLRNTIKPFLKYADMNYNIYIKDSNNVLRISFSNEELNIIQQLKINPALSEFQTSITKLIQRGGAILTTSKPIDNKQMEIEMISEPMSIISKEEESKLKAKKKMLEIQNQFKKKQIDALKRANSQIKDFNDNSGEDIEKNDNNANICIFCHEKINILKEKYGLPAYIHPDNIYDVAYENHLQSNLCHDNDHNDQTGKSKLWQAILLKNQLRNINNMRLTYCEHPIHITCHEKDMQNIKKKEYLFNDNCDFFCTLCNRLSNIIIQCNQLNIKPTPPIVNDMTEDHKNNIGYLVYTLNCLSKKVDDSKESNEVDKILDFAFFSNLVAIEILSRFDNDYEDNDNTNQNSKENLVLELLNSLLEYNIKFVELYSFKYFVSKCLTGFKYLVQNFLEFYKSHKSNTKDHEYRQNIAKLGELVSQAIPSETNLSKIPFLSIDLNDRLLYYLQYVVIFNPFGSQNLIKFCIRLYLIQKMFQYKIISLKEDLNVEMLEQMVNDKKVVIELMPTYKKVLAFLLINISTLQGKVNLHNFEGKTDEEIILNFLDSPELNFLKVENIIKDIINDSKGSSLQDSSQSDFNQVIDLKLINSWKHEIDKKSSDYLSKINHLAMSQSFDLIHLPDVYYDLNIMYYDSPCEICKSIPKFQQRAICLICGMVLCVSKCKGISKQGILNKHSKQYHCSISIYVNIESTMIYLINSPKNIQYLPLYVNKYGEALEDKSNDWKGYYLNIALYAKLKEIIVSGNIPQEICYEIMNRNEKYQDGALQTNTRK